MVRLRRRSCNADYIWQNGGTNRAWSTDNGMYLVRRFLASLIGSPMMELLIGGAERGPFDYRLRYDDSQVNIASN